MDIAAYAALVLVLSYCLVKSADLVEDGFAHLAKKIKISSFVLGFFILGFASSLTEIAVAVTSAVSGNPELSSGNLIGSSLVVMLLVLGLNAIRSKKIPFRGSFGMRQVWIYAAVMALQVAVILDQEITANEGIFLLGMYLIFAFYVFINGMKSKSLRRQHHADDFSYANVLPWTVIGMIGLGFFATNLVQAAIRLATLLNVDSALIGVFLLALGTNLPELTVMARAKNLENKKLAVGNFLGSACLNVGTLGLLGLISPHRITTFSALAPGLAFLAIALVMFVVLARTGKEITRKEGLAFIGAYLIFVCISIGQLIMM
jgi:cation:H+ antiporter